MTIATTPLSRRHLLAASVSALALAATGVHAQTGGTKGFPSGPIKFIVPFPAGTGADLTARLFAKTIGELSGQSVVVENKAGANGVIAVQALLQAPADGQTVFLGSNSTLSTNAALFRSLPYDPVRDLAPITVIGSAPCVVIVPPQSPIKTLAALVAEMKKRPDQLNYGAGSPSYTLYTEWMNELAGTKAKNIPYKGASEVMNAVAGGQLDFGVVDSTAALQLIKGGRLRALAITGERRSSAIPDVPTSAEAGLPKFLASNWTAAAVSAKTPAPIVHALETLFQKAGKTEAVQENFRANSSTPVMSTGVEMRKFQTEEIERWKRLAEATKLQVD
jgi:tripartite-type tricarboxylate transporter receptor subunit TctC